MKRIFHLYRIPLNWLHRKLSRSQFLTLSAFLVGLTAGFAAIVLKTLVHYIHLLITINHHIPYQYLLIFFSPLVGILLTVLFVHFFLKGRLGKGVSNILYEIAQKSSFVAPDKMYSHIITSSITVGFGGSAGLEAPIVVTGSAIGSNYGRTYEVNYKDRTVLLASGAAAGIAAVFNAPVAGVMFAIEVLLAEISITELIPIILASVSGALCSKIVLQEDILFFFKLQQNFDYLNVPFYLLLGGLSGLMSIYYSRTTHWVERFFERFKHRKYLRVLIGGLTLAVLCFLFPPLFGEGYESIKILAEGDSSVLLGDTIFESLKNNVWFVALFMGAVAFIKVIATSTTLSSGGNGGNFAPSLFVGAYFGYFFSHVINNIRPSTLSEGNFTIVGMAGILSGVMYAPLTAIFLIAEITGGYELIIPLMIVSATSFFIAKHFEPYSMDTKKMATKGQIFTSDKDRNILTLMKTQTIIEKDIKTIREDRLFGELIELIKKNKRNIFAVVNKYGDLEGIVTLDDVRHLMFRTEMYNQLMIKQIMKRPPITVQLHEDMKSVMKKFDETNSWNLPVLDGTTYIGFISKSSVFTNYRNQLIYQAGI